MRNLVLSYFLVLWGFTISFVSTSSSADLDNWHLRINPAQGYGLNAIAYGNGIFVAVGENGTIITSGDGTDWKKRDSGVIVDLTGIAYGNGIFVAVGKAGEGPWFDGVTLVSQDGINWGSQLFQMPSTYSFPISVAYGNGTFVTVGIDLVGSSQDGRNWSFLSTDAALAAITYGNGSFLSVGSRSVTYASADGITWIAGRINVDPTRFAGYPSFFGIAYGNDMFAAVGGCSCLDFTACPINIIMTSSDMLSWTERSGSAFTIGPALAGVAYGSGYFVAVGSTPIESSQDGINWNKHLSGLAPGLAAVAFGAGTFVAVGQNGIILQSGLVLHNCVAILSPTFSLEIPALMFNGTELRAELQNESVTSDVMFKVTSAEVLAEPNGVHCGGAVLYFDNNKYKLNVPSLSFNNALYWAEFEYVPTADGNIWFKLTAAGMK